MIGAIGFLSPWLLLALVALPILWIILRAVPPAPIRRIFPGVTLLLGLKDEEQVSDRTPWWLLLLRMLAIAALIVGLAGPILNPRSDDIGRGPLLIAMDASWASAADWNARISMVERILDDAQRTDRTTAILNLSAPEQVTFQSANEVRSTLAGLTPNAWEPSVNMNTLMALLPEQGFDTLWLSDELARQTRDEIADLFNAKGALRILASQGESIALAPARFEGGATILEARRSVAGPARTVQADVHGKDPSGAARILAKADIVFESGAKTAIQEISLPAELRARVTHFALTGVRSAGAVSLSDDSLRRREVALIAGREDREGLELLSPLHYLRQALEPNAELLEGSLLDILPAAPDVVILADVAKLAPVEEAELTEWVQEGGLLVRFAGTRLAASEISRSEEDTLMPVRLRAGGRTVGGAMSWGTPKELAAFTEESPFFGLEPRADVTVRSQVMAQPDPTLADRVIASLSDGTPLVTRKPLGDGQVVLFHVTANAEWSSLPLSGLFVSMLDRLAISSLAGMPQAGDLDGSVWQPISVMDGFGRISNADSLAGIAGERLLSDVLGPDLQPGLYEGNTRRIARNVISAETELSAANWPSGTDIRPLQTQPETPLAGILLGLALALLMIDIVASLAMSGRLRGAVAGVGALMLLGLPADAQQDDFALAASSEMVLGYVITRDEAIDNTAEAGLRGLSETLFFRTSIEPADPIGVDLETDELAFFPMLYWPITPSQPTPSANAYAKLNEYLRSGGMILFDTRDADIARFGASSPNGTKLRALAEPLDIPPLEPLPQDHVLTRTFYLLQDFPGRHTARDIWVEAAPKNAERIEGMPFRNLNDGVSPVVIGGNDWAAAWAMDTRGNSIFPIGRGFAGERQRELAYRFGVNLVMHVLTGNYKSDQVHVPALLDRLGQ
ncbi:putative membrane protein (TIGR02226 family) [Planktotalea frisia]|jgi:hypothetical protein|uniref:Aerotolerance regulator N-terminal domain-containing protein n=2 Tax=Planktotalea frisia TaxID=696762 RepID=A0A1L9NXT8_9RHOB|nr:DUF4159 domain-containing protein [Planktotalea frisia]OJI94106.1 hypothetical protein PFRI_16360 [Planktotalea frisia]PZX29579.1 putative membrane protein (TIGR02226 family) [Planktotalea frisia]